ncbi:hypothetical protein A2Z22_01645 [Candidatus Woesebacteria bacterium RBG_16_34_12]|uniref:Uncharacterized protein n=1 Tax=Candidatus Woesebacteria bacterium RBG_16_34_12 TaxID=1802480 RepID=A0A1F7XA78_9BACT|nr:MAG: hypothetical protein A2Z22_01645 [Candidatus Woesebacteria bacterium RBG_16_34_12]
MSKIFYDHLIVLEDLEKELRDLVETYEEREELWQLIDEIIHHRVLGCILVNLPSKHHEVFITRFCGAPHDETLLQFVNELVENDIEEVISKELQQLQEEIVEEMFI